MLLRVLSDNFRAWNTYQNEVAHLERQFRQWRLWHLQQRCSCQCRVFLDAKHPSNQCNQSKCDTLSDAQQPCRWSRVFFNSLHGGWQQEQIKPNVECLTDSTGWAPFSAHRGAAQSSRSCDDGNLADHRADGSAVGTHSIRSNLKIHLNMLCRAWFLNFAHRPGLQGICCTCPARGSCVTSSSGGALITSGASCTKACM